MVVVKLRRIGVLSFAKIEALLFAMVGLLAGIFYTLLGAALGAVAGQVGVIGPMSFAIQLGYLAIIALPTFYGIFGFIVGAIVALLYNLVAALIGGVEMDFEE